MAISKCQHPRNDVGSLVRLLISTISCGGGGGEKRHHSLSTNKPIKREPKTGEKQGKTGEVKEKKLVDLLNLSDNSLPPAETRVREEVEVEVKEERLEELRGAVKMVRSERVEERELGAKMVRRLAKEDCHARSTLAMLGAIPPLVAMINVDLLVVGGDHDHDDEKEKEEVLSEEAQIEALYALLNLGIGNDLNKAAIVQVGAVHKMLKKFETGKRSSETSLSEAIVANFLALSALDTNKTIIGTSGAIPFLVTVLEDSELKSSFQAKQDALRALYNLSILPSNISVILETNLISYLVNTLGDMEVSERILSILSNVVSSSEGRKAISSVPESIQIFIDILNWGDSPGCQEKASYVLMVMAHKSYSDRQTMIENGIGSALLELTLLGSTLAQKRASRILECLRMEKGKQVSRSFQGHATQTVSAPIYGCSSSSTSNINKEEEDMMSEEKKAVKQLVQQSLQNNMRRIVKRANLPQEFVPSEHLKSLTASSTSKSLPF